MKIFFTEDSAESIAADWLLIVTTSEDGLGERLGLSNPKLKDAVAGLCQRGDFSGKEREVICLYQRSEVASKNVILCGCGAASALHIGVIRKSLLTALRQVCTSERQSLVVCWDTILLNHVAVTDLVATLADAVTSAPTDAGLYRKEKKHFEFNEVAVCGIENNSISQSALNAGIQTGIVVNLTKDLVNQCPGALYPETFTEIVIEQAAAAGLACSVLDETGLRRERMGAFLAVAQGSERTPRLVKLEYRGTGSDVPVVALVGKGVTFDSGGYSLKTSDGMLSMKSDMAGAATVVSVAIAVAALQIPVNLNVYVGLVENMVSGKAYKPGDVLTTRSGTTVEIHNTDAEGRLVLADLLDFAVEDGVARIVDVATLTGACVIALGEDVTGLFANDADLANGLLAAADSVGEGLWQMPMFRHYEEQLKSDVADIRNIGSRWGGAITAAKFLQRFARDLPWAHLDIAGPSFASSGTGWRDSGATACMVRSLITWLASNRKTV